MSLAAIAGIVVAILSAILVVLRLIPGDQYENQLEALIAWIKKFFP